jgi:flagellar biosynthesis/type III secretory pathway protein FliH
MVGQASPRVFEIVFRSRTRLRDVVRADPHLPLPAVPAVPALAPRPIADPMQMAREERHAIEQTLAALRAAVEQLGTRHEAMIGEMRQAAIELAMAVAGRVVFDKLQAGEFPIEEMVRQSVARLPAAPAVKVYLHPDDLALLRRRLGEQALTEAREPDVRLETEAALKRGGCRAEAGEIHVLADLANQLAELRQHLLWSTSHAQSGPAPAAS